MAEPVLDIEVLRKSFGALLVTDDVSLHVAPHRIHAVIGPNGAGKTTLIQQISGALKPDSGRIRLAGQDITALAPHLRARLGLARVFQITSILPEYTALENVSLAVQARHGSAFRMIGPSSGTGPEPMRALDRVGLAPRHAIRAQRLSHGEKRRLELAMALAVQPRLMLLDEPLAGAGPEDTASLITLLAGLKQDCAILLVEHDMDAVFKLADDITVLALGRVIARGTPAEIKANPAVRAAYLGEDV